MQSNSVYVDLKDKDIGLGWPEPALREGNGCDVNCRCQLDRAEESLDSW